MTGRATDTDFGLPVELEPMEARSADALPGEGCQYEPKWDGFRCLAFKNGSRVDLRAKSGKPLGRYFPEVVALLSDLDVERFVFDGELVIDVDGKLSFDALQMRLHPAESRIRKLSGEIPARLVMFDMLMATDGIPILDRDLNFRRAALEMFAKDSERPGRLILSPHTRHHSEATQWLSASGTDTDGVVCKRLDGRTTTSVLRCIAADSVPGRILRRPIDLDDVQIRVAEI